MSTETVITSVGSTGQVGWGSRVGSTKGRALVRKRCISATSLRLSLLLA